MKGVVKFTYYIITDNILAITKIKEMTKGDINNETIEINNPSISFSFEDETNRISIISKYSIDNIAAIGCIYA